VYAYGPNEAKLRRRMPVCFAPGNWRYIRLRGRRTGMLPRFRFNSGHLHALDAARTDAVKRMIDIDTSNTYQLVS